MQARWFQLFPLLLVVLSVFARGRGHTAEWPEFRGPTAQGHAPAGDLALTWSEEANVRWKVPLPGKGWSSPVGDDHRLWMTTALDAGRSLRVLGVDTADGRVVHNVEVFAPEDPVEIHETNSHASPTPIVDGQRLYVHYGSMGTACLETKSAKVLWRHSETQVEHATGPGTSPVLYRDTLIVPFDGADKQFVLALDKETGAVRWRRTRSAPVAEETLMRRSFCTPLLVRVGDADQLISPGPNQIHGYDAATGKEIWHVRYKGFSVVPRPVYADGMVFFSTGYMKPSLYAVRLGGSGDVTSTHVAWTTKRQVPTKPSPLLVDGSLYMISNGGIATCLDAASGEEIWVQRLPGDYSASPIYANGRLYFASEDGQFTILEPGNEARVLATNRLDGHFMASPAVLGEALYLRSETHLYRVEKDEPAAGK